MWCLAELLEGSVADLFKLVNKSRIRVNWHIICQIALDAAEAVLYLHNFRPQILHRDLKSENLLLDANFRCKLSDFGLSRQFDIASPGSLTVCGSLLWVAPEIFRGEYYTDKVDVYSFAIVLWELCCLKKPYEGIDIIELPYYVGKLGKRPDENMLSHVPPSYTNLMKACWHSDPSVRPSFREICQQLVALLDQEDKMAVPVETNIPFEAALVQR